MIDWMNAATASNATPSEGLTLEKLRAAMSLIDELPPAPPQVRIVESWMAIKQGERARRYPKRKAKSERHWHRMDKKWLKRYGFHQVPTAYALDTSLLGGSRDTILVVHPALAPSYYKAIRAAGNGRGEQ